MPKLLLSFTASTLALLTLLAGNTALAQDSRWFRVELLIFTNQSAPDAPAGAAIAEQWDATPPLTYPDAARFLIDPAQVRNNAATYPGTSELDQYGRQIIVLPAAPGPTSTSQPVTANRPGLPRPFVQLPNSYQEFRGKAAVMQRSGGYNVLFHQTWVQPVPPEGRALPIVLDRSGDTGQWSRLQGSIKLYLSRYLQVETNLWLNTDGAYLPGTWRMPAPPLGPPALVIEEPFPELDQATPDSVQLSSQTVPGQALPAIAATAVPAATDQAGNLLQPVVSGPGAVAELDEEALQALGPVYPYRHAVLLEQKRRMRSTEVHYIDHPLFGLVIKFSPITAEELQAVALEQGSL